VEALVCIIVIVVIKFYTVPITVSQEQWCFTESVFKAEGLLKRRVFTCHLKKKD